VLGEDAARALGIRAPEASDLKVELADTALPRQVAEMADIPAVDAARPAPAGGTGSRRGAGTGCHDDTIRGNNDPFDDEAGREQRK
jgi:hypothetical protein